MSNIYIKSFSLQVVRESSIKIDSGIGRTVSSPETVHRVMIEGLRMDQEPDELTVLLTLDTKKQITGIFEVSRGTLNSSIVHPRDIFKRALLQNAANIIMVHNHPSGDPMPSKDDIEVTRRIEEAGKLLGIQLIDHIIIGDEIRYESLKQAGYL